MTYIRSVSDSIASLPRISLKNKLEYKKTVPRRIVRDQSFMALDLSNLLQPAKKYPI